MALYKYGLAFLAGTGFGAAMTSIRNSRCPLHKLHSCSCHRRRRPVDGAGESPAPETGREREQYYDAQEKA
ncbi:unnamed protein product [Miscanthus lutarioriparius]|uniref:Uncharacterized protein n=1 Tax=Miscanthus lutarioriparius TaxID=422564 RepID=A0A811R7Z0_9POAL|nr:unnamed protein product [Miscanthus lutarioriparius]